jgi:hypothetical protein
MYHLCLFWFVAGTEHSPETGGNSETIIVVVVVVVVVVVCGCVAAAVAVFIIIKKRKQGYFSLCFHYQFVYVFLIQNVLIYCHFGC